MKKVFTILMILLFGISSSGATIQLHYCCGKLKNISFGSEKEKGCCAKLKKPVKKCCETKTIAATSETKEQATYTITTGMGSSIEPAVIYHYVPALIFTQQDNLSIAAETSPPLSKDISILNCVFRI